MLIALAVILAFVFNFLALQDRSETELVAITQTELVAGSRISASDIRFVVIDADFAGIEGLVTERSWAGQEGWVITRPLPANTPLDAASLAPSGDVAGLRHMSVPVSIEHAAGGLLKVGDRVDVISVGDAGPAYVASDLLVVSLADTDSTRLGGPGGYFVVLAVTDGDALALAGAIDIGSIDLVRATPGWVEGGDGDGS